MCGLSGLVSRFPHPDHGIVCAAMRDAMAHRGPDDAGLWIAEHGRAAIGSRRLAIIDLSPAGHMPMLSEDGRVVIAQNGEIYNYRELREELMARGYRFRSDGDTEVALCLYLEHGPDFLSRLNGMFALAIWDDRDESLLLARDRLGKKPLVMASTPEGGLCFASEIQGLLQYPGLARRVDLSAIDYFLRFGYIPAPKCAFADVEKLQPGHYLIWKDGQRSIQPYWTLPEPAPRARSDAEATDEFLELFRDSVRRRLISDVPLGAFLSGGIDSGAIVATMADFSERPVETFSIGFGASEYNELPGARLVAERYATNHHEFVVEPRAADVLPTLIRHYGEPYADSSALPTYYLAKLTRQHVTVALNGDGGDELLGGYDRYRAALLAERIERVLPLGRQTYTRIANLLPAAGDLRSPVARARRFLSGLGDSAGERYTHWMSMFQPELLERCATPELREAAINSGASAYLAADLDRRDGHDLLGTLIRLDQRTYLPGDLLVKADIATMANSLEGRSPFLDYRLIEWAATLPTDLRVRGNRGKYLLRHAMRDSLPAETLKARKRGFGVPIAQWLRGELRPMVEDTLLGARALGRGYLRPEAVRSLVSEHVNGRADHAKALWCLLVLELWHQQLVDSAPALKP